MKINNTSEFFSKLPDSLQGKMYAVFTDRVALKKWNKEYISSLEMDESLLELRVFNEHEEYKLFRSSLADAFHYRRADDSKEYIEETQYLKDKNSKLRIHNFISYYEESGQAYISDWRMVDVTGREW